MRRAICIGCGCGEQSACPMDPAGFFSCWWMRFDAATNTGVCSACWDRVKAWKAGERAPQLPMIAERYYRQVLFLYPEKAEALLWVALPQELLGDRSPRELILAGQLERVEAVVDQLRSGAFV